MTRKDLDNDFEQKYNLIPRIQLSADSEFIEKAVSKAHSLIDDSGLLLLAAANKNSYKGLLCHSGGYSLLLFRRSSDFSNTVLKI